MGAISTFSQQESNRLTNWGFRMNKKIAMLNVGNGYDNFVIVPESVPPQGIFDLMTSQVFCKEYNHPWQLQNDKNVGVIFVDPADLPTTDNQPVIEMREVLEENNRLTRENERLIKRLAKLESINVAGVPAADVMIVAG